jgi:thioredoxin reductase
MHANNLDPRRGAGVTGPRGGHALTAQRAQPGAHARQDRVLIVCHNGTFVCRPAGRGASLAHEDDRRDTVDESDDQAYDVVVVGGGAAGLSGALTLGRAGRSVLVVDAGDPRNARAGHVHNYLTRDGAPPAELVAAGRAEVVRYGCQVVSGRVVEAVRAGDSFAVTLDGERGRREVRARRLLVTTGLTDELPDVPGLAQRWGRDVLHCPYCHGWEIRGRRIGVLATGPSAFDQANLWRQWSPQVLLLLHHSQAPTAEEAERLAARGITVVPGSVADLQVTGDALTGVRLSSGEAIELDALVVAAKLTARAGVLESLGLKPVDMEINGHVVASYLPTDPIGATVVPGVWAAGNVTDPRAQVISAAAAGLTAGAMINTDLIAAETRDAVDAYRHNVASTRGPKPR